MQASLIIATFNQAKNLKLILESVKRQSCLDFEIIIADDGSTDNTENVINEFRQTLQNPPIIFLTQVNQGFRKTIMLNNAIRQASTDYLIFIDGDMLLDKQFVENHLSNKDKNSFLCGHRGVKMGPKYSQKIVSRGILPQLGTIPMIARKLFGHVENPLRSLKIKNPLLRKIAIPYRDNLSGCNFSIHREALYACNGFNEDILMHGYNDFELGHRLKLAGYRLIDVSKLCNTYHIYHPTRKTNRAAVGKKIALLEQNKNFFCKNGLKKADSPPAIHKKIAPNAANA
jgi:glycosyltransferase involved in cell wall biosynthesis